MAECELCGARTSSLVKSNIEGSILSVCHSCARYGSRVVEKKGPRQLTANRISTNFNKKDKFESEFKLISNYASLIQKTRSKLGKTQKEFAAMLNEKESVIHHMESGTFTPSDDLAKKIQKILNITLIEKKTEDDKAKDMLKLVTSSSKSKGSSMTFGDLIKIRKR